MKHLFITLVLAAVTASTQAKREYRYFKDAEGRTIRGAVVSFDSETQIVTFERDNRRTAKVPITVFCEADQNYIRSWEIKRVFESTSLFKVSVDRQEEKNEAAAQELTRRSTGITFKVEDIYYEILLENRSAVDIKDISLDYCIFYEQGHPSGEDQGVLCGSLQVDEAPSKSKKSLQTEAVSLYKSQVKGGYVYNNSAPDIHGGDIDGIWIRITMNSGKQRLVREYSDPTGLSDKQRWFTESIAAGIN